MAWSDEMIQKVWEKGNEAPPNDPDVYRTDACGAWIKRTSYGMNSTKLSFGWEIDHIDPDGGDDISNLQPLQWENNRGKADNYPKWDCTVTRDGKKNKYK